jgi:hypothetical protein
VRRSHAFSTQHTSAVAHCRPVRFERSETRTCAAEQRCCMPGPAGHIPSSQSRRRSSQPHSRSALTRDFQAHPRPSAVLGRTRVRPLSSVAPASVRCPRSHPRPSRNSESTVPPKLRPIHDPDQPFARWSAAGLLAAGLLAAGLLAAGLLAAGLLAAGLLAAGLLAAGLLAAGLLAAGLLAAGLLAARRACRETCLPRDVLAARRACRETCLPRDVLAARRACRPPQKDEAGCRSAG